MVRAAISLDRLRAFVAVMELGSFTAAARRLRIRKNAISQQIGKLEQELGVGLFVRTTRMVAATQEATQLYKNIEPLLQQLQTVIEGVGTDNWSGVLRITAPSDYVQLALGRALASFGIAHPRLRIELVTSSEILDIVSERIDLAVHLGWPKDSSQRAVKIGEYSLMVVGSAAYLADAGVPVHPDQLASHRWVELNALPDSFIPSFVGPRGERAERRLRAQFGASTMNDMLALVRSGAGLAIANDFLVAQDLCSGALVQVLRDWRLPMGGIYLTWRSTAVEPPRLRALIDHLRKHLGGMRG